MNNPANRVGYDEFTRKWRDSITKRDALLARDEPKFVEIGSYILDVVHQMLFSSGESYRINTSAPRMDLKKEKSFLTISVVQEEVKFFKHDDLIMSFEITNHNVAFDNHFFPSSPLDMLWPALEFKMYSHFSPENASALFANTYNRSPVKS